MKQDRKIAHYHLPGLFEFYDFYEVFLPLYQSHREYFYDWCDIGSIYGSPQGCLWAGGRTGSGTHNVNDVIKLTNMYEISARLTLSNSLLQEEHLRDSFCNELCRKFEANKDPKNGIIVTSDLLLHYLKERYPNFYFVSSTTKILTNFSELKKEIERPEFEYVVPDFRLNHDYEDLFALTQKEKDKVEFLCNECCWIHCQERKECYENVSLLNLGKEVPEHLCKAPHAKEGYRFSKAMENPSFISVQDIQNTYLPMGFTNFKIEGRELGSALLLEFILYYMTKPECQLKVREEIYLDNMLDLF